MAVNHLVITAGASRPPCIIRPSSGSSNHLRVNQRRTGFSWRGRAASLQPAPARPSKRPTSPAQPSGGKGQPSLVSGPGGGRVRQVSPPPCC